MTCACGCGSKPKANNRFVHGHNARNKIKPNRYRVEDCGHDTPCWVWQLHLMPTGYGQMAVPGNRSKKEYAHRWYYEQAKGAIPQGMYLDHLCRNRACCNPDHLEVVSPRENCRRGSLTKLSPEDVAAIRKAGTSGEMRKDIAARFGVTPTHVAFILNGKTWRDGARTRA
jgi:hypothetical protein